MQVHVSDATITESSPELIDTTVHNNPEPKTVTVPKRKREAKADDKKASQASKKENKGFRLDSTGFFLTYPQCPLDKETVRDALQALGTISKGVIARELHKDSGAHIHAYVKYDKKKTVRHSNYFDIGEYHPNTQTAKSSIAVMKYIKKDGDFIEMGDMDALQE